jgi:hypothetical protein
MAANPQLSDPPVGNRRKYTGSLLSGRGLLGTTILPEEHFYRDNT